MDPETMANLEALERTAAWVHQVSQMKNVDIPDSEDTSTQNDIHNGEIGDFYAHFKEQFETSYTEIDIPKTVQEFRDVLEKSGISQRFAAKYIMEQTSQGNLSFLLEKGKTKKWSELSHRGRVPYIRMRRWLDNADEQKQTLAMLRQTKEYKKTGPKDGSGKREKFTLFQLMVLCRFYEEDSNPNLTTRTLLAEKLDVPLDRVTIWFQNQRARGFPAKKVLSQANFTRKSVDMGQLMKQGANSVMDISNVRPSPSDLRSTTSQSNSTICQGNIRTNGLEHSPVTQVKQDDMSISNGFMYSQHLHVNNSLDNIPNTSNSLLKRHTGTFQNSDSKLPGATTQEQPLNFSKHSLIS